MHLYNIIFFIEIFKLNITRDNVLIVFFLLLLFKIDLQVGHFSDTQHCNIVSKKLKQKISSGFTIYFC